MQACLMSCLYYYEFKKKCNLTFAEAHLFFKSGCVDLDLNSRISRIRSSIIESIIDGPLMHTSMEQHCVPRRCGVVYKYYIMVG